jgi:hypothetical protein
MAIVDASSYTDIDLAPLREAKTNADFKGSTLGTALARRLDHDPANGNRAESMSCQAGIGH